MARFLKLVKLRGVELKESELIFTLKGGFKVLSPFKPEPILAPKKFQPVVDPPGMYSTGIPDLDTILGGGVTRGSYILLETDGVTSTLEQHLLEAPMAANFLTQGRCVTFIPSSGVDYGLIKERTLQYVQSEEEFKRLTLILEPTGFAGAVELSN